ncbi:MAG: universal stress protein [Gammaproteobacteria bacterium]|nr:universal stress protein [Gammaproteobacteria bacterium]
MPYQKILIAINKSELSMRVAEQGIKLAIQLDANIALASVIDTAKVNKDSESGSLPQDQITKLKKEANQTIDHIVENFPECKFDRYVSEGKPSKEIIKIAGDWEADLIVMGTQGKTGLKRLFLGSTAENTIRLCNIPLLVVPTKL